MAMSFARIVSGAWRLFSESYIPSQGRQEDLDRFFKVQSQRPLVHKQHDYCRV